LLCQLVEENEWSSKQVDSSTKTTDVGLHAETCLIDSVIYFLCKTEVGDAINVTLNQIQAYASLSHALSSDNATLHVATAEMILTSTAAQVICDPIQGCKASRELIATDQTLGT
jgi:hypothetical protein